MTTTMMNHLTEDEATRAVGCTQQLVALPSEDRFMRDSRVIIGIDDEHDPPGAWHHHAPMPTTIRRGLFAKKEDPGKDCRTEVVYGG